MAFSSVSGSTVRVSCLLVLSIASAGAAGCSDHVEKGGSGGDSDDALSGGAPTKIVAADGGPKAQSDATKPVVPVAANCLPRCLARVAALCGGAEACNDLCEDVSEAELACLERLTVCDKTSYLACFGETIQTDAGAPIPGKGK